MQAKNKKANEPSTKAKKSDAIRAVYKEMVASGVQPKQIDVVNKLKADGITVSPAQVSQIIRKESGDSSGSRQGKTGKESSFTIEEMVAARKLIARVGNAKRARALLDAMGG